MHVFRQALQRQASLVEYLWCFALDRFHCLPSRLTCALGWIANRLTGFLKCHSPSHIARYGELLRANTLLPLLLRCDRMALFLWLRNRITHRLYSPVLTDS